MLIRSTYMTLLNEYQDARRDEDVARLRRVLALRAMVADGMSQRAIAEALGISQPAVSQQLKAARDLADVHPEMLIDAAASVLVRVATERGFGRLAVFGSVARRTARADSDLDLIIDAPSGTTITDLLDLRGTFEQITGREVDLITYGGLKPAIDDDIRRELVEL